MSEAPPIAFVVQRYGPEITGGSESLARALAERLAAEYQITVFTTCARDYVTWRNEWPAGEEEIAGVRARRRLPRLVEPAGLLAAHCPRDSEAVPGDQPIGAVKELAQSRDLVEPPEGR